MFSKRFNRTIYITRHAKLRMEQRQISNDLLLQIIENGTIKYKDEYRLWIFKEFNCRIDNLLCAVVVLEDELIIKTVMHNFEIKE